MSRGSRGPGVQYLVKWRDLEYSDATWEWQEELQQDRDKAAIEAYKRFDAPRGKEGGSGRNAPSLRALRTPDWELPTFCSGRKLREYQEVRGLGGRCHGSGLGYRRCVCLCGCPCVLMLLWLRLRNIGCQLRRRFLPLPNDK